MFKIFNRNYDYTLTITYDEVNTYTTINPVFGGNGGITIGSNTETECIIIKRYKSFHDVQSEFIEIEKKTSSFEKIC
jgi:hypothetical protein